jgi:hypothetical protein
MQRLCRLPIQLWPNFVQTSQQCPRCPEEFRCRADGFAFARNGAGSDPDCEGRKSFGPLQPLFQNGQPGQVGVSVFVNLFDDFQKFFGNICSHEGKSFFST